VAVAPVDNGLYQLKSLDQGIARTLRMAAKTGHNTTGSSPPNTIFSSSSSSNCNAPGLDILHVRLGHTSTSKMQHISLCKQFLSHHTLSKSFPCDVCVSIKMQRLPFNKSTITTTSPFQLIHSDVWGPYKVANVCGAHYFLTIVDNFTRTTWTKLLQSKTQVDASIIHFFQPDSHPHQNHYGS